VIVLTIEADVKGNSTQFRVSSPDVADAPEPPHIDSEKLSDLGRRSQLAQELDEGDGEVEKLGRELFDLVFSGVNRELFVRACERSSAWSRSLLFRVHLPADSPLLSLGWEWLHDGRHFLARSPKTSVVRWFSAQHPVPSLSLKAPLRVLLTTAGSEGENSIDGDEEEVSVRAGLADFGGSVDLKVEHGLTIAGLDRLWREARKKQEPFHLWHHCGHGGGLLESFQLALDGEREDRFLDLTRLKTILGPEPGLCIALFQTCFSGSRSGLTRALAELQVPVVIGFQRRLYGGSASLFARSFYASLVGRPVEFAATDGRISLAFREWSQVVVVSRRRDEGVLLKVDAPAATETPQHRALRRQRLVVTRYLQEKRQAS
jgi:hypothetical protein